MKFDTVQLMQDIKNNGYRKEYYIWDLRELFPEMTIKKFTSKLRSLSIGGYITYRGSLWHGSRNRGRKSVVVVLKQKGIMCLYDYTERHGTIKMGADDDR